VLFAVAELLVANCIAVFGIESFDPNAGDVLSMIIVLPVLEEE